MERGFDINERYTKKTDLEHVLLRPDTYVGGVDSVRQEEWVINDTTKAIVRRKVTYTPALIKIFDEILVNARDHTIRDDTCTRIHVNIDAEAGTIIVKNNGTGIPIEMHKEGCLLPELIFGHFRSGENFADDKQRVVGGKNGYGGSLANAFSSRFEVDTIDGVTKQRYVQVWEQNMSIKQEPVITKASQKPYTKITFTPDFERLGCHGLDNDTVSILQRRVYDMAACTRPEVLIYLNGEKLAIRGFERYINLYLGDNKTATPRVFAILENDLDKKVVKQWEVGVALSDDGFKQVSFVNGVATSEGGTHVNYIRDQLVKKLGRLIREKNTKETVKPAYIRENLWLFVNAVVINPSFSSQTKDALTSKQDNFGFKHVVSNDFIEVIEKRLKISRRAIGFAELRKTSALKGTGGGKTRKVRGILKLEDAKYAGTKRSAECTLILTEGDSAKTMALHGLQVVGQDFYGVFPLKGVPINARNKSDDQLAKNEEFINFMKIVGLQPNAQYKDASQLRYGSILLMTDQDLDGFHIKGIKINNILTKWPSLIKIPGFIKCFVTPIVKVCRGKREMMFFNMSEFDAYKRAHPQTALRGIRYLKGLGSSEPKEAKEYFSDLDSYVKEYRPMSLETSEELFKQAFSNEYADWRKKWLSEYDESKVFDYSKATPVFALEDFIDYELKHFSVYDNKRSLGHVCDGLKTSQRKVVWAFRKMGLWTQTKKVLAASGEVSTLSSYHHGEQSLMDTIVGMAQTFVNANNVNLLYPSGQFGSRIQNGQDASSARYIHTRLNDIVKYMFPAADDPVLQCEEDDEGKEIEPKYFVPVIAQVLVNGCNGIGTGYSTTVLKYHPIQLIDAHIQLIEQNSVPVLEPWYRDFTGSIIKADNFAYISYGIYKRADDKTVVVTELPVGHSFEGYKEFLSKHLIENAPTSVDKKRKTIDRNKYFIKEFDSRIYPDSCEFKITFATKEQLDELFAGKGLVKKLNLSTNLRTSNMHLFNADGAISKFESPEAIIRYHYNIRMDLYAKRKAYQLHDLEKRMKMLDRKKRFVELVLDGTIDTRNKPKQHIADLLKRYNLTDAAEDAADNDTVKDCLTPSMRSLLRISMLDMTKEEVEKFMQKIKALGQEYETLRETSEKDIWLRELRELRVQMEKFFRDAASAKDLPKAPIKKKPTKKRARKK